jgi:hypothetical protein
MVTGNRVLVKYKNRKIESEVICIVKNSKYLLFLVKDIDEFLTEENLIKIL